MELLRLLRVSAAAKEMKMRFESGSGGRAGVHVVARGARTAAACGLRGQATGDARHPRGGVSLNRSAL